MVKFINFLPQERLPHSFSTHFLYHNIEPEVFFYRKYIVLSQECHESRYTVYCFFTNRRNGATLIIKSRFLGFLFL